MQDLVDELGRLPGVGPKSAQRIAFHLMQADAADAKRLAQAIVTVKETIRPCTRCFNLTQQDLCAVCRDTRRDQAQVCVVAEPRDLLAIERTREYRGTYHVLGGVLAPLDGVGPNDLTIAQLLARLVDTAGAEVERGSEPGVERGSEPGVEVILALNPNAEGEATASYLTGQLRQHAPRARVTRLASGLPVGGDLDYADEVTLARSFAGRLTVQ